jgi:hypothetical protein
MAVVTTSLCMYISLNTCEKKEVERKQERECNDREERRKKGRAGRKKEREGKETNGNGNVLFSSWEAFSEGRPLTKGTNRQA